MKQQRVLAIGVAAVAVLATSCSGIFSASDCTTEFVYGLEVTVLDSLTNAPAGQGAVVSAASGDFADTARADLPGETQVFRLVGERAGTYDVTVERTGYRPWRATGVRVDGRACHVSTTRITALLQPIAP